MHTIPFQGDPATASAMLALRDQISSEAYEICDRRGDTSREALRSTERMLNCARYLEAIRPYTDAKVRILSLMIVPCRLVLRDDGHPHLQVPQPEEFPMPDEARAALAQIDEAINQTAVHFGFPPPMPKG